MMSVQYYREDGMDRVLITVLLGWLHDNSATRPRPGIFGYSLGFLSVQEKVLFSPSVQKSQKISLHGL